MLNKLKELRALNAFAKKQSVGMQRKLMLYWVSMILVVFTAVVLLLSVAGAFSQNDEQLHEVMELHLQNTQDNLAGHLDRLTAQSLNLSKELSREIEGMLVQEGISLQEVNNDPELTRSGCCNCSRSCTRWSIPPFRPPTAMGPM